MKRDLDLEREILLAIEAYAGASRPGYAGLSRVGRPLIAWGIKLLHAATSRPPAGEAF